MKLIYRSLFALAVLPVSQLWSLSLDISEAEGYNLVTWGNANLVSSSVGGRVAAGGNSLFKWYSIGGNSSVDDPANAAYVVGGNLNAQNGGSVGGGNIYVGGNYNGPGYNLNTESGSSVQSKLGRDNLPFDFDGVQQSLTAKSQLWAQAEATGTSTLSYSTLNLEGNESGLNIFNLDASLLEQASSLNIIVPEAAKVLINITGSIVEFGSMGFSNSSSAANTLFNFFDASKLTMANIGLEGSILAVNADLKFYSGSINGQVIAESFRGQDWGVGSLGNYEYNNDIGADDSYGEDESHIGVSDSGNTLALSAFGIFMLLAARRFLAVRNA